MQPLAPCPNPLVPLLLLLMVTVAASAAPPSVPPAAAAAVLAPTGDLETVLSRLYAKSMPSKCADVCSSAASFARTMQSDGSWKDLNYMDKDRTVWADVTHFSRLSSLAEALHCKACGSAGRSRRVGAVLLIC